jgi:hypothetical protein
MDVFQATDASGEGSLNTLQLLDILTGFHNGEQYSQVVYMWLVIRVPVKQLKVWPHSRLWEKHRYFRISLI